MLFRNFTLALATSCLMLVSVSSSPRVSLSQGDVVGRIVTSYGGRKFMAFEGIPFAQPPIGKLRFKEPVPAGSWNGTLNATKYYKCPTFTMKPSFTASGEEDCLYLYVYVPLEKLNASANLPVIAYVHGGGFWFGSPGEVATPNYLMDQDVVLVTFNYRLGVLGYLSTQDDTVPGNNGLKDQTIALRWIRDNIARFGGNPASVTLFGISSGGSSVHLHYLSPWSRGLFHRGYASSGTALTPFADIQNAAAKAKGLAKAVNCTTTSSEEMVECLRALTPEELMRNSLSVYDRVLPELEPGIIFGPVAENNPNGFLPRRPIDVITSKKDLYDVPWITSVTHDDGMSLVSSLVSKNGLEFVNENWESVSQSILYLNETVDESMKPMVLEIISQTYFGGQPLSQENIHQFVQLLSDRTFFVPAEHSFRLHASINKSPTYFFMFSFLPEHYIYNQGLRAGVAHATDEQMYFKLNRVPAILAQHEEDEMKIFTKFLADYARTGVPKIEDVTIEPLKPLSITFDYVEVVSPGDVRVHKGVTHVTDNLDLWDSLPIKNLQIPVYTPLESAVNKVGVLLPTRALAAYYT